MRRTATSVTHRTGAIIVAAALISCGEASAQSTSDGLSNLFGNIFSGSKPETSAPPQAAPGPDGGPPPWSGEDGASGHPLMTASAIRQAAANFPNCVAAMWPDAARRNVTQ
ncbi:MAG: lytic murein transglycosylase, partial [Bradyrhizobium sp.]